MRGCYALRLVGSGLSSVYALNRICCRWPVFTTYGIYALRFGVLLHLILQVFLAHQFHSSERAGERAGERAHNTAGRVG